MSPQRSGKVFDENGKPILTFGIYAESVARKDALRVANKLLRKHEDGKVVIQYPSGEKVTISISKEAI